MNKNELEKLISDAEDLIAHGATSQGAGLKAWRSACTIFLANNYGKDSIELSEFKRLHFSPTVYYNDPPILELVEYCRRDLKVAITILNQLLDNFKEKNMNQGNKDAVFIVHGHDGELKYKVKNLLTQLNLNPVILHEQINKNDTVIEKLENYGSQACAAIVLITPDDYGQCKTEEELKQRARQNVIFEAGYFIGLLGRKNVILVVPDEATELPSDLNGVVYTNDSSGLEIAKELKGMGLDVDLNKLF